MSCLGDGAIRGGATGVISLLGVLLALTLLEAPASSAAAASPHWSIASESQPTFFKAGDSSDAYVVVVRNDGAAPTTHGSAVTIADTLPADVTATKISAHGQGPNESTTNYEPTCPAGPATGTITCTYEESPTSGPILAGATIVMTITVAVEGGIDTLGSGSATISGGGAPSASTSEKTPLSSDPVPFGLSYFNLDSTTEEGLTDTLAGTHPFELLRELRLQRQRP